MGRVNAVCRFVTEAFDNVGSDLQQTGELNLLKRLQLAGFSVVIDAGANVGDWTLAAARTWSEARVHAFEIAPETSQALAERVAAADLSERVVVNRCGLGSEAGTRRTYFYPDHPEITCDAPRFPEHRCVPFEAQVLAGDDYLDQRGLSRVDFLKIDVEGAEHLVLAGFSRALASGRVRCIQFEYGAFSVDTRMLLRDYYALLSKDFLVGKIFPDHVEFRDYLWTMEDFRFANLLCIAKSETALIASARN